MKRRIIKKSDSRKTAIKTDQYLTAANNILTQNRRLASSTQIKAELKREFEDAQKHLDVCAGNPSKWRNAKAENCQQYFRSETVGNAGIAHMQGIRPTMEDTHIVTSLALHVHEQSYHIPLYGIFDGHGGNACTKYLVRHLPAYLKAKLEHGLAHCSSPKDEATAIFNILKLTFVDLGAEYRGSDFVNGGSTANIALIYKKNLWVANVGDTRAILSLNGHAVALSEDAKPAMEKYRKGVEKRQCVVIDINGVPRVEGVMAVARAVGHSEIASGISPRAKITKYSLARLPKTGNYLIIACDGLWDVASSNQVAQTVAQLAGRSPENIAVYLIRKSFEAGSADNISALVVAI